MKKFIYSLNRLILKVATSLFKTIMSYEAQEGHPCQGDQILTFSLKKAERVFIRRRTVAEARQACRDIVSKRFGKETNFKSSVGPDGNWVWTEVEEETPLFESRTDSKVYTVYLSAGNRRCPGSTTTPSNHVFY
jgi:hypothetical protein